MVAGGKTKTKLYYKLSGASRPRSPVLESRKAAGRGDPPGVGVAPVKTGKTILLATAEKG